MKIKDKLEQTKNFINRERGEEIISSGQRVIRRISSGSHMIDKITGGIPLGLFSYFYGNPMSGKTTIALTTIANAQREGLLCAYLDAEKTYSSDWASIVGVDSDNLLVASYSIGEPIANTLMDLIRQDFDLIVVDSIAALCPQEFLKGFGKSKSYAPLAQIVNPMVCAANGINRKAGVIFINQPREKIGVLFGGMSLPGGKALAHYSALSLKFWVSNRLKDKKNDIIGREITCKVEKNKLGPAENEAIFNIYFNSGIDNNNELLTIALEQGIIKQSGTWLSCNDEKYQGRENFLESTNYKWKNKIK